MVKVEHLLNYWEGRITAATNTNYKLKFKSNNQEESFLKTRDQIRNDEYSIMQSVRNVEPSTKIKINQY